MDLLAGDSQKVEIREKVFMSTFSVESVFGEVANGDGQSFKDAFKFLVDITERLFLSD